MQGRDVDRPDTGDSVLPERHCAVPRPAAEAVRIVVGEDESAEGEKQVDAEIARLPHRIGDGQPRREGLEAAAEVEEHDPDRRERPHAGQGGQVRGRAAVVVDISGSLRGGIPIEFGRRWHGWDYSISWSTYHRRVVAL